MGQGKGDKGENEANETLIVSNESRIVSPGCQYADSD